MNKNQYEFSKKLVLSNNEYDLVLNIDAMKLKILINKEYSIEIYEREYCIKELK